MAYVNKETSKRVKAELTKEFPAFKFSVTVSNYSSLNVTILSAPIMLLDGNRDYEQVNEYHIKSRSNKEAVWQS